MSKTPKADALRAMREQQIDQALKRWADDKRAAREKGACEGRGTQV